MGARSSYAPGTFCWVDLSTSHATAAAAFYGALFGWQTEDVPAGESVTYNAMLHLDGAPVAALYGLTDEQQAQGVRPHWLSYVSVEDVDASAQRVAQLGGTVCAGPFDVMDAGRMAVLIDPAGALLALWQAGAHHGAARVNDPGCLTSNTLVIPEPASVVDFYGDLFGWSIEEAPGSHSSWTITNDGAMNGGIMQSQAGGAAPHWAVFFTVTDTDADAALVRVGKLGGHPLMPPIDVPSGRFAVAADPQGATFCLWEGSGDD